MIQNFLVSVGYRVVKFDFPVRVRSYLTRCVLLKFLIEPLPAPSIDICQSLKTNKVKLQTFALE